MIAKGVTDWLGKSSLPRWALVVTALVELALCADYHQRRWDTVLVNYPMPPERGGEGLVTQWNRVNALKIHKSFDHKGLRHKRLGKSVSVTPLCERSCELGAFALPSGTGWATMPGCGRC